mgnify:CR=1 FL=1
MKLRSLFPLCLSLACLFIGEARSATVIFDNVNGSGNAAYGIRDADGVLVSGVGFQGALGYFTISNSAISSSFAGNDLAAIQSGFTQFDPVDGTFSLSSLAAGAFQTNEIFDTKASSNTFGGSIVYAVLYKGTSIATATELLIAQLNAQFPTDPEIGLTATLNVSLAPSSVTNLVVGSSGGPAHDYGLGGGELPTFGMVAAVPEPSRSLLLLGGLACLGWRRRQQESKGSYYFE